MKELLFLLITMFFFITCSESPKPVGNIKNISTPVKTEVIVQKLDFNIAKFITQTNSLLTSIQGKAVNLNYITDSVTADNINKRSPFHALDPSVNNIIKRYLFDPGKDNRELSFWIIEATYKDTAATNKVFAELHRQSNKVNGTDDFTPGLTYVNDYVIKLESKIYWLNSGCTYAFFNHQKLKQCLVNSLLVDIIQDSIWCKCGQPKCSL